LIAVVVPPKKSSCVAPLLVRCGLIEKGRRTGPILNGQRKPGSNPNFPRFEIGVGNKTHPEDFFESPTKGYLLTRKSLTIDFGARVTDFGAGFEVGPRKNFIHEAVLRTL